MSFSDKYGRNSGCCGDRNQPKSYTKRDCCTYPIPLPPKPSCGCENDAQIPSVNICFYQSCTITATSNQSFFLSFWNDQGQSLPLNSNMYFFVHPSVGFMRILSRSVNSYEVELVDKTKNGMAIQAGDCVTFQAVAPQQASAIANQKCLCSKFNPPQLEETETIWITNGASIPANSLITFNANGSIGSYEVVSFVSSQDNVYAYKVRNVGDGHTPGIVIDGGDGSTCEIAIEVLTEVDTCGGSEVECVDTIVSCLNKSPKSFKPPTDKQIMISEFVGDQLKLVWTRYEQSDCCFTYTGCAKFKASDGVTSSDVLTLTTTPSDCLQESWDLAQEHCTVVPVTIEGIPFVITSLTSTEVELQVADPDKIFTDGVSSVEFEGKQVCLGECCNTCLDGEYTTNHSDAFPPTPEQAPGFGFQLFDLPYTAGLVTRYLIGYDNTSPLNLVVEEVDPDYFSTTDPLIGGPRLSDPLLLRQKLCHFDPKGCPQKVELDFTIDVTPTGLEDDVIFNWEVGHFAANSATLEDGTTVNPFFTANSQNTAGGCVEGPTRQDSDAIIGNTALGLANAGAPKPFPYKSVDLNDKFFLTAGGCAVSLTWLYAEIDAINAAVDGTAGLIFGIQRRITYKKFQCIPYVPNDPTLEGFS